MTESNERLNIFFRLAAISAVAFIVTVLAMTAVLFGNQNAPVARFLNEYGLQVIAVEVALTLTTGLAALTVDRMQITREQLESEFQDTPNDAANELDSETVKD